MLRAIHKKMQITILFYIITANCLRCNAYVLTFPCQNDYNEGKIGVIDLIGISRTALTLFGLDIHWYAVLIALGAALGMLLAMKRERGLGLPTDTTMDLMLAGVPSAIIGARLYYVVFSWESFAGGPLWRIFDIRGGGMAIYGGLLGAVLAGWVYAKIKKLPFASVLDLAAPCFALGQAVGRWGNFINQEAHGGQVLNEALKFFPVSVEIGGQWYYATFFYESVWCVLIVAAVLLAERKRLLARRGDGFLLYAFLYAMERAVVEGVRADSLYLGGLRVSQSLSLLTALAVTVFWAARLKRARSLLRVLAPSAVLTAAVLTPFGPGAVLPAAAVSVVVTVCMYCSNSRNRGEK